MSMEDLTWNPKYNETLIVVYILRKFAVILIGGRHIAHFP